MRNRPKRNDLVHRALGELFAMALGELGVSRKHARVAARFLDIEIDLNEAPKKQGTNKKLISPEPIHVAKGVDYFPPTVKPVTK